MRRKNRAVNKKFLLLKFLVVKTIYYAWGTLNIKNIDLIKNLGTTCDLF